MTCPLHEPMQQRPNMQAQGYTTREAIDAGRVCLRGRRNGSKGGLGNLGSTHCSRNGCKGTPSLSNTRWDIFKLPSAQQWNGPYASLAT
mmetsp:Transcript_64042/g.118999  ORF Transcript_64042/g.118999 Transcript_64042/m.118999 type:complete len:89 (-) Transcript_64042:1277-1543(-)